MSWRELAVLTNFILLCLILVTLFGVWGAIERLRTAVSSLEARLTHDESEGD